MRCPECNGKTTVLDGAYVDEENEKIRRRKCKVCGNQFYTSEVEIARNDFIRGVLTFRKYHRTSKFSKDKKAAMEAERKES